MAEDRLSIFRVRTKLDFLPMLTTEAASHVPNNIDFIYIDARHDYCGVKEDIETWWPKLIPGGFMAGHDYLTDSEVHALTPWQNWSVCGDGAVYPGAVKQAVNEFVQREMLTLRVTADQWPTWIVRKPGKV
jgi:predicted O-methyltransferase YrrM